MALLPLVVLLLLLRACMLSAVRPVLQHSRACCIMLAAVVACVPAGVCCGVSCRCVRKALGQLQAHVRPQLLQAWLDELQAALQQGNAPVVGAAGGTHTSQAVMTAGHDCVSQECLPLVTRSLTFRACTWIGKHTKPCDSPMEVDTHPVQGSSTAWLRHLAAEALKSVLQLIRVPLNMSCRQPHASSVCLRCQGWVFKSRPGSCGLFRSCGMCTHAGSQIMFIVCKC